MTLTPIKDIKIGDRFRSDYGDIPELAESIKSIGLLQPICITSDSTLIAGARRIQAYELLGLESIDAHIVPLEDIVSGEYAENEVRKNFTVSERVAILKAIDTKKPGNQKANSQHVVNYEQAAKQSGFGSRETARRAKKIIEQGSPDLIEQVDQERISVGTGFPISKLPKDEQNKLVKEITDRPNRPRTKRTSQDKNIIKFIAAIEKIAGITSSAEIMVQDMDADRLDRANQSIERAFLLIKQIKEVLNNAAKD